VSFRSGVCGARNLNGAGHELKGGFSTREVLKRYWVYIMGSATGTLYTGVTNDIQRRVFEHKRKLAKGFTAKYGVDRLVYLEETNRVVDAIQREKEIKGWRRSKKRALVESINPKWEDLSAGWYDQADR
jgi:putative endonuclease